MNEFLKSCRKLLSTNVCWILGNESCDLDSAVSAICLAYYYKNMKKSNLNCTGFIPIMNVPRRNFPLKTEVTYFLKQNSIDFDNLLFIDEIEKNRIETTNIILVDHHVSPYYNSVVEVYDHRPLDPNSNLNAKCMKTILEVGSCSTIIGSLYLELDNNIIYKEALRLLYAPIVLDTINFSEEADKARELDIKTVAEIEKLLNIEDAQKYRKELFDKLVSARADISSLDSYQVLFKDMKLIRSLSGKFSVALPGFPMLVQEYIKMPNIKDNIQRFATDTNSNVILLLGMKCMESKVERDLGLINISHPKLFEEISSSLQTFSTPNLNLKKHENCNFLMGHYFYQNNVQASRKQILPILKVILDKI